MIFIQFLILILFGQLLHVDYLRLPLATLLVAVTAAACIAALGLLIGVFAKSRRTSHHLRADPHVRAFGSGRRLDAA